MLSAEIKKEILLHAKKEYPRESCGVLIIFKGRLSYEKCLNIAETPDEHFVIDPKDYLKAEQKGSIVGIVHSHPVTEARLSPADKVACERSNLPWYVVNPQSEEWGEEKPSGFQLPYIGREFVHGVVDCYSLWKDWYKRELKIDMNEYQRRDQWWEKGQNLYLDNYKNEGMREIPLSEIDYGDIILIHLRSLVPNHAAIYIGNSLILHHVQGRLSSRDIYGGYYQKNTAKILRHESR